MTGPEVTAAMKAEDAWVEKGARAMWNAQTRQPWQQIDDGDEWPSWVDLATRNRLREKFRHALAAVLPEIQAQALNGITEVFEIVDRHTNRRLEERVYLTSNEALNHVSTWDPIDQRIARVQSVARLAATTKEPK